MMFAIIILLLVIWSLVSIIHAIMDVFDCADKGIVDTFLSLPVMFMSWSFRKF